MRFFMIFLLAVSVCSGCTQEQAKRATYETLKNMKAQRCDDRLVDGCQEPEKYDTYQRQRQEILNPDAQEAQ
jgi:hypothetical protein